MNAGMTDQCIAVAKPCGYESHFITTSAAPLFHFINSWCLEIARGAICSADEGLK